MRKTRMRKNEMEEEGEKLVPGFGGEAVHSGDEVAEFELKMEKKLQQSIGF